MYFNNLDALRALAVTSVLIHHVQATLQIQTPFLGLYGGAIGVMLFFVLSGYLISDSAARYSLKIFALHRFFRIFPAYWLAFLGIGLLSGQIGLESIRAEPESFILNLLNLQQLNAYSLFTFEVLHVSWTLTIELLWYVLAPFLMCLPLRWTLPVVGLSACISLGWWHVAQSGAVDFIFASGFDRLKDFPALLKIVVIHNAFPAQLYFFALGWAVYRFQARLLQLPNAPLWLAWFGFLGYLFAVQDRPLEGGVLLGGVAFAGVGIASLLLLALKLPGMENRMILGVGKISYSIYLVHFPVLLYVMQALDASVYIELLVSVMLIALLASVMYVWIEKPAMRLARKWTVGTGVS